MYNKTSNLLEELRRNIKVKEFRVTDFWSACPYTFDELVSQNRAREIVLIRGMAMSWEMLSGRTLSSTGRKYDRGHATVYNALKVFVGVVQNIGQYPEVKPILDEAIRHSYQSIQGVSEPYFVSAINLEMSLKACHPKIFVK